MYNSNNEETRLRDLKELIEGVDIDPVTFQKLADIQLDFRTEQSHLVNLFDAQAISPEEYLDKFNSISSIMFESILTLVGDEKYRAIFGEVWSGASIIDREIFLGQFSK